ncbi:MAG TPA: hypothetical protein VNJ02_00260 [Vicinamibacterales bacterium]|nr:hypothetical protein [Vicinamibacterales bacterium]
MKTPIEDLVRDIRTVATHVASNYNCDYGPDSGRHSALVQQMADPVALETLIRWVFFVSDFHADRCLDTSEQRAFDAALRLHGALKTIVANRDVIRAELAA